MDDKKGSFKPVFIALIISLAIASLWNKVSWISQPIHYILDPTLGGLLRWNLVLGMIIIVLIINLVTTIIQKYATDQEALKAIRKEQKALQEEMKKFKDNPQKMMEKQSELMRKNLGMMKHQIKPMLFTFIPLIIIFGWLRITYEPLGKLILGMSWFWIYLISAVIFSMVIRKVLKIY